MGPASIWEAGKMTCKIPANTGSRVFVRGDSTIGEVEMELHCACSGLSNEGEPLAEAAPKRCSSTALQNAVALNGIQSGFGEATA